MATIQSIAEQFGSKDSSNRTYVSAASIMAQAHQQGLDEDTIKGTIDTFNEFISNLRNRGYETVKLPSGTQEHRFQALKDELFQLRLRIESKSSRLTGQPYTSKTLIIVPNATPFEPIDVTKIRTISRPSNPSIEDTRTNEERQYDHEEAMSKQEEQVSF